MLDREPIAPALLLDLRQVDPDQRSAIWAEWIQSMFPGLQVAEFHSAVTAGRIWRRHFGPGLLWTVTSPTHTAHSDPALACDILLSGLALQKQGNAIFEQGANRCRLRPGDFTLIDADRPFSMRALGIGEMLILQFPTPFANRMFPELLASSALAIESAAPVARILSAVLFALEAELETMAPAAAWEMFEIVLRIVGMLSHAAVSASPTKPWRIERALQDIDMLLEDCDLRPEEIARRQGISRRRLDMLFKECLGATISAQILEQRLQQTAAELKVRHELGRTITDIALGAGFRGSAHFSNAFRKRFDVQPRQWGR